MGTVPYERQGERLRTGVSGEQTVLMWCCYPAIFMVGSSETWDVVVVGQARRDAHCCGPCC